MFNALCENGKAEVANYPFCTIEPNVGIVAVPDERLQVRKPANLDFRSLTFLTYFLCDWEEKEIRKNNVSISEIQASGQKLKDSHAAFRSPLYCRS